MSLPEYSVSTQQCVRMYVRMYVCKQWRYLQQSECLLLSFLLSHPTYVHTKCSFSFFLPFACIAPTDRRAKTRRHAAAVCPSVRLSVCPSVCPLSAVAVLVLGRFWPSSSFGLPTSPRTHSLTLSPADKQTNRQETDREKERRIISNNIHCVDQLYNRFLS